MLRTKLGVLSRCGTRWFCDQEMRTGSRREKDIRRSSRRGRVIAMAVQRRRRQGFQIEVFGASNTFISGYDSGMLLD
ncbi:hypothetical protein M8C21_024490 [Ambrosia artemisiifolia]|uniref:Uncharacterized protein n=1 Tax=Ambrosia artemisiifolia TaxID=4212 RepID=A0AAD5GKP6_AMBAR|nr:hypothetical protein M8C21_024490 [Ambrosia artemisiifolia]